MRPSIYFNVHLVSDSTGETLNAVMRAAAAQFENVTPLEHNYYLVRSDRQLDRVMRDIEAAPGVVWFTISDEALRLKLETFCRSRHIPTLAVLDPSIHMLSRHLGVTPSDRVAGQHALNAEYFERIEAITFALAHDDGQNLQGLLNADVILLGVSRKRMIGALSNEAEAGDRLGGSVALAVKGMDAGVQIIRVHDVAETVQARNVWRGLRDAALTDFADLPG